MFLHCGSTFPLKVDQLFLLKWLRIDKLVSIWRRNIYNSFSLLPEKVEPLVFKNPLVASTQLDPRYGRGVGKQVDQHGKEWHQKVEPMTLWSGATLKKEKKRHQIFNATFWGWSCHCMVKCDSVTQFRCHFARPIARSCFTRCHFEMTFENTLGPMPFWKRKWNGTK